MKCDRKGGDVDATYTARLAAKAADAPATVPSVYASCPAAILAY